MKKFIYSLIVTILALCPMLAFGDVAVAVDNGGVVTAENGEIVESKAYDYTKAFVQNEDNNNPDYDVRLSNRASYLKGVIEGIGYEVAEQSFPYINKYTKSNHNASNLIATLDNPNTDKYVVISCNYDNAEGLVSSILKSDGTSSNGVGVGITLAIMEKLNGVNIDYDIQFVFFAGSELGLLGSKNYISEMGKEDKENLLLMINISGVGAGDNTYLYDDEMHWEHYDYLYNIAKDSNIPLQKVPVDKKVILAEEQNIGLAYNHQGLLSDNATFIADRLPTISFFSGNYTNIGFVQSAKHGTIFGSSNDTLSKFDEIFGDNGKKQMNDMVSLVEKIVTDKKLGEVMARSIQNKPDYSFFSTKDNSILIISCVVAGVVVVSMIVIYMVLKSKADKSKDPIKPLYFDIDMILRETDNEKDDTNNQNAKPKDPFGLDDDNDNNNNNDENPFGY